MTFDAVKYEALAGELEDAGVVAALPEVHGGICGVMCVGGVAAADRWLEQCIAEWRPGADLGETLRELELDTWRTLSGDDMSFEPLLPSDDEPMDAQVRGLALWCHGFLTGLGFGGLTPEEATDDTGAIAEIAEDFAQISRAGLDEEEAEDPEETGFALAELKEYVRVSVQLVFDQLDSSRDTPDSIH